MRSVARTTGGATLVYRILATSQDTFEIIIKLSEAPVPLLLQCPKSQRFGHSTFKENPVCGTCTGPHKAHVCHTKGKPKCFNNDQKHPAYVRPAPCKPLKAFNLVLLSVKFRRLFIFFDVTILSLVEDRSGIFQLYDVLYKKEVSLVKITVGRYIAQTNEPR